MRAKDIRSLFLIVGFASVVLSGCTGLAEARRDEFIKTIGPNPRLTPEEVVHIQMTAFEYNDETNGGIEIAYRFASPSNKSAVGSLRRYIRLINSMAFRPMLGPKSVMYDEAIITGNEAKVRIYLTSQTGYEIVYVFTLTNQSDESCDGCWMTDSVYIERVLELEKQSTI